MTKEILLVAEAVSNEKGVSEDIIFEAIELALATATKKRYDEEADIHVTIDRKTGDYVSKRRWLVVPDDEVALLGTQFTTEEAIEQDPNLKPGDIYEEEVENVASRRIAAQTAKQVIVQRVRDAERAQVVDHLALLVHHVVIVQQALARLEVLELDSLLRLFDRSRDERVGEDLALLRAHSVHQSRDPVRSEQAHQIIL